MLKRVVGTVLMLSISSGIWAEPVPRYATQLENYSTSTKANADSTRLRVSVATDLGIAERSVRVGDVMVCSASACFKARSRGYVDVHDTSQGKAALVADAVIPIATITAVYFSEVTGGKVIDGHVKLGTPLVLEKEFHGAELLIVLKRQQSPRGTLYVPTQTASNFFNPESQTVHYNPSVPTVANLSLGTVLSIPAGALDKSQVFSIGIHDVGERYPMVDIYPYLKLKKAGSLQASAIRSPLTGAARDQNAIATSIAMPSPEEQRVERPDDVNGATKASVNILHTGVVKPADLERSRPGTLTDNPGVSATPGVPASANVAACALLLSHPFTIYFMHLAAQRTGAALVKACENAPPYVHIAFINTYDPRIKFSLPYSLYSQQKENGPFLSLKRIIDNPSSMILMNGFTWSGEVGNKPLQWGKADGFLRSDGAVLGDNLLGGGALDGCPDCAISGTKFAMAYSWDKARPNFFTSEHARELGYSSINVVSTSTSIVKNGVCASAGSRNRWSAVGAYNGKMIFISSTSNGTTTAEELCAVFKALGVKNALRMDGGPSTSFVAGGKLLNPITGLAYVKYGSMRSIAYPLRISH